MELKAFKGMPHEFGGIDYTEGSEVEGGEFAVQIGKSGNEYIFDKNSSEGERLSKEYKKLDKNGRLTEDDPLALEAFDQIAREEALKHAQRSVNEKGIDPFRNMYDQAGQAANGGVKYATGGPIMNPAEVPNVNPGAQYNTSMSYVPKTAEEHYAQNMGESRTRDSFGTQDMRTAPTTRSFKEIGEGKEFGMLMGDIFLNQFVTPVTGKSFSELEMGRQGYTSSDATKRAVGDDTMTGTAFGYGFAESEGVISNMGTQFFNMVGGSGGGDMMGMMGGMMGADGGAMPKDKYSMGGGMLGGINTSLLADMASTAGGAGGGVDGLLSNAGVSAGGGGISGAGYLTLFEAIHNFRQGLKGAVGPALDEAIANNMGEEYVRKPIAGQPTTSNSNIGNLFGGMDFSKSKRGDVSPAPATALGGTKQNTKQNTKQEEEQSILDQGESFGLQPSVMNLGSYKGEGYLNPYMPSTDYSSNPMFADPNKYSDVTVLKNGGAKPIYGYYANGGGKKKEEDESYDDMKDPVQWDVMQNYIASNDTRDRMSQAAVGSGDEMYAPYRLDNTCVAGVNCFEDLAGVQGIPDDIYNNRALRDFFESKEGKKSFRKAKNEKPGDYVQFEEKIRTKKFELPNGEIISIPTGEFNYPYHIGMVTGDDIYLGDGSRNNPLYYSNIYKEPSIETSNLAGIDIEYNNINPNFYRIRNRKDRQKVIDAALQAKQQGKDVIRPAFGDEEPLYLPLQQYRKNTSYPIAGF